MRKPKSDAVKLAEINRQIAMINAGRDIVVALEPLVTIVGASAALGYLENHRFGATQYQLISTNQKRALLTGVVAIEVARAGLIGQISGLVKDVGSAGSALLSAGKSDLTGVTSAIAGMG